MPGAINEKSTYSLGVDLNRKGLDETAFVVIEQVPFAIANTGLYVSYMESQNTQNLGEAIGRILYLHSIFNFSKIFIDTTGLGGGVTDILKEKIVGGVVEEVIFTKNTKADMFNNLYLLLQQGGLKIPDYVHNNDERAKKLFFQLLSIQKEFKSDSDMPKITHETGSHDDLVCALALASLCFRVGKKTKRGYPFAGFNHA